MSAELEYSGLLVTNMNTNYHIKASGTQFAVIDPWGEQVGTYPTEEIAQQDIERCKKEDSMYETAHLLVDIFRQDSHADAQR